MSEVQRQNAVENDKLNHSKSLLDGVAIKLALPYLEELHGDNSLEPGEVTTPPHHNDDEDAASPGPLLPQRQMETLHASKQSQDDHADGGVLRKGKPALPPPSSSWLPLASGGGGGDGDRSPAEHASTVDRRRHEKGRRSGRSDSVEHDGVADAGCVARSAKKATYEQNANEKRVHAKGEGVSAAASDAIDKSTIEADNAAVTAAAAAACNEDDDSEGLYSSSGSTPERSDELRRALNEDNAAAEQRSGGGFNDPGQELRQSQGYPPFPGYRPFLRVNRPDFMHSRGGGAGGGGGFFPRGRGAGGNCGGMRPNMRFPFRAPFFGNGAPLRNQMPHPRHHTPPPARGHSPILAPETCLLWTKAKPSISYALNVQSRVQQQHHHDKPPATEEASVSVDVEAKPKKSAADSKVKRSQSKERKRAKKSHERDKMKKRRMSRSSSERSEKRQLEKIRELMKKSGEPSKTLYESIKATVKAQGLLVEDAKEEEGISVATAEAREKRETDTVPANIVSTQLSREFNIEKADSGEPANAKPKIQGDPNGRRVVDTFSLSPPPASRQVVESSAKLIPEEKQDKQSVAKMPPTTNNDIKMPPTKVTHQKAIEMQRRIDKLLQDDDLNFEAIEAAKEKLLQTTRKQQQQQQQGIVAPVLPSFPPPASAEKKKSRTPTPEPPKRCIRNPFKRSMSRDRDRFFGRLDSNHRSRSRSRDREPRGVGNMRKNFSGERSWRDYPRDEEPDGQRNNRSKSRYGGGASSCNPAARSKSRDRHLGNSTTRMTHSRERDRNGERRTAKMSRSPRRQSAQSSAKSSPTSQHPSQSHTPPRPSDSTTKTRHTTKSSSSSLSLSNSKTSRLSFNVAELCAAPANNNKHETEDPFSFSGQPKKVPDEDSSPDTDDYMDNWESDVADVEANSNAACESLLMAGLSTTAAAAAADEDDSVTRFANPSPPMELLKTAAAVDEVEDGGGGATPPIPPQKSRLRTEKELKAAELALVAPAVKPAAHKNLQLFGMQEIYDQFIKSVEQSGVDMVSQRKPGQAAVAADGKAERKRKDRSSTSASSSSSPSSTTSSSSEEASNTSSSSSTTHSSSDESNKEAKVQKRNKKTPSKSQPTAAPPGKAAAVVVVVKEEPLELSPCRFGVQTTPTSAAGGLGDGVSSLTSIKSEDVLAASGLTTPPPRPATTAAADGSPGTPAKTPRSAAAKDFKKLRSLEANLARIQLMRANYDSTDDISEELLKMEKLFMQERNVILHKYAKAATTAPTTPSLETANKPALEIEDTKNVSPQPGQFVSSLHAARDVQDEMAAPLQANSIFDANREAIKLTISPLKLSRTPAIFDTGLIERVDQLVNKRPLREIEETDFTEKLAKPAKEIAIVKPIMETKESKELRAAHQQQRSRRASRSPSGATSYRDRSRRSTSRMRTSPQRRGRGRSLSNSPPRRGGGNARHGMSPQRRLGGRYRAGGRRSRSRSRSPSRQNVGSGGRREFSPAHRRRRGGDPFGPRKRSLYRQQRDSRSRSPRPHSPRSPPPPSSQQLRRSWSRERFSRSPLPFKPPSPPLRRSSLSPGRQHRSRSRSPRMPRSPRSPPPHACYDMYGGRYDRRSTSPLNDYYAQDAHLMAAGGAIGLSSSSYYYNMSPNRISLDARINIVLNGPPGVPAEGAANITSYDAYSSYSQYGSAAYMTVPPQPQPQATAVDGVAASYYANPYLPMAENSAPAMHHGGVPHHAYSSIPTIGGGSQYQAHHHTHGHGTHVHPPTHFYYNNNSNNHEEGNHGASNSSASSLSVLKELPKSVAVQKGNVLEIVPFAGATPPMADTNCSAGATSGTPPTTAAEVPQKKPKRKDKSVIVAWREEVKLRQEAAAALRLARPKDGTHSILKRADFAAEANKEKENDPPALSSSPSPAAEQQDKKLMTKKKKKVFFEDGIFPQCDSDDEDRKIVEAKMHRKLRKLRRKYPEIEFPKIAELLPRKAAREAERRKKKIDAAQEKQPPTSPPGVPSSAHLEQPLYLRPPTPTPMVYFHYDPVVHSMYVSQLERAIPPRLLNAAKSAMAGNGTGGGGGGGVPPGQPAGVMQSPSQINAKKDLTALAALNRSTRGTAPAIEQHAAAPKTIPILQRHDSPSSSGGMHMHMQHQHHHHLAADPLVVSAAAVMAKSGSFQSIGTLPPPHGTSPVQRPVGSPLGFVGMRINTLTRLPSSPLVRGAPLLGMAPVPPLTIHPPAGVSPIPVLGIRHNFQIPPPMLSATQQQQQQTPPATTTAAPIALEHNVLGYGTPPPLSVTPIITSVPPPTHYNGTPPHHHRNLPPPGYFLGSTQTPPPVPHTLGRLQHSSNTLIEVVPRPSTPPPACSSVMAAAIAAAGASPTVASAVGSLETAESVPSPKADAVLHAAAAPFSAQLP